MLLREALDRFGKAFLEDVWTGEELLARNVTFTAPQPPSPPRTNEVMTAPGSIEPVTPKVPYVVDGKETLLPYGEALARYDGEEEELVSLWHKEVAALKRYGSMVIEFRKALFAEHVPTYVLSKSGDITGFPKSVWASDQAWTVFRTGQVKFHESYGYGAVSHEGVVLVSEGQLESYLKISFSNCQDEGQEDGACRQLPTKSLDRTERDSGPSSPVGRRPKWDWEALWLQMCVTIHNDGLPETQADLVRKLQAWFSATYGEEPSESQIRARTTKVFRELRDSENS